MNARLCILPVSCAMLIGCGSFPTSYDRVDADRIRTLDFMYEPAEAVPGDTVTLTAVFAGKRFEIDSIQWSISYEVVANNYGVDTAVNLQPLEEVAVEADCLFSGNTQCVVKQFVIPDDVIANSPAIPANWLANLPQAQRDKLPEQVRSITKQESLTMLTMMASKASEWNGALHKKSITIFDSLMAADSLFSLYYEQLSPIFPAVLQMFSVPIRIFADLPHAHRVQSTYTVRYNRLFSGLPVNREYRSRVYENNNPVIDSVIVYKVNKANILSFDPEKDDYRIETMRLHGPGDEHWKGEPDTLVIDKNYSYFLACGAQPPDTFMTMDSAVVGGGGTIEKHTAMWYYQLEDAAMKEVSNSDYMAIVNMGNIIAALIPSSDAQIRQATIWLELRDGDGVTNESYHPMASALKEVSVAFRYTRAYLDAKERS